MLACDCSFVASVRDQLPSAMMVQFESMSIAAVELRVLLRQKIECLEELYIS